MQKVSSGSPETASLFVGLSNKNDWNFMERGIHKEDMCFQMSSFCSLGCRPVMVSDGTANWWHSNIVS